MLIPDVGVKTSVCLGLRTVANSKKFLQGAANSRLVSLQLKLGLIVL